MKTFALLLFAGLVLLGVTSSSVGATGARPHPAGIVFHNGRHATRANAQLFLHAARRSVRASTPTCNGSSCTSYENAINQYFMDVAAASANHATDNVYSVATQYSGIQYNESWGKSYVDTTAYPPSGCNDAYSTGGQTFKDSICLTDLQLQTAIERDIAANNWPNGGTTNLFFIFTPSDVGICTKSGSISAPHQACSTNVFCAFHSETTGGIIYAVQPYNATIPGGGCDSGNRPNGNDADLTLNTVSHEQNEAITDANTNNGWYTGDFNENGDLCAWTFGEPLGGTPGTISDGTQWNQVINTHHYWLQQEYSNEADITPLKVAGCVKYRGGPPTTNAVDTSTNPPTTLRGPLVNHGGSVMTTNTVYAIYWVPGAAVVPVNNQPPVVSGVATVGNALTTSDGGWSNSPTSYAYQWQSCSSSGTSCANISGATTSSYTLQPADAGHTIRAGVSATNAAGTAHAVSSPTAVVVGLPQASTKPRISGKAKVGKRLTATSGSWSGSPSSFRYQWLRCSAAGGSCARIARATRPTYTLRKHDVKHRLRVTVTASNLAGHASSTSAPTARVKR